MLIQNHFHVFFFYFQYNFFIVYEYIFVIINGPCKTLIATTNYKLNFHLEKYNIVFDFPFNRIIFRTIILHIQYTPPNIYIYVYIIWLYFHLFQCVCVSQNNNALKFDKLYRYIYTKKYIFPSTKKKRILLFSHAKNKHINTNTYIDIWKLFFGIYSFFVKLYLYYIYLLVVILYWHYIIIQLLSFFLTEWTDMTVTKYFQLYNIYWCWFVGVQITMNLNWISYSHRII